MNPPDQPTPRTDEAYFAKGATMYSLAGEMKLLERELAAAKAECERFRLFTLKQDGELTRLRAQEIDYVKMISEVLKCEPRSACEQPDNRLEAPWDLIARLRAEVERLRDQLAAAQQREAIAIASWDEERNRALREGERVVEWRDRTERYRLATLKLDAELATERARLDWLESDAGVDWQWSSSALTIRRAVIDAAIKEDAQ